MGRVQDPAKKAEYQRRWYEKHRQRELGKARARYEATKHLRPKLRADRETTLYRFFDREGVLLYVGITYHFDVRLTQHRIRSKWFESVDRWTLETYTSRRSAKVVETQAIREELPRFNRHESTI